MQVQSAYFHQISQRDVTSYSTQGAESKINTCLSANKIGEIHVASIKALVNLRINHKSCGIRA